MILSTQGRGHGHWWPLIDGTRLSAIYYCNECASPMTLLDYQILQDGKVNPSVVCPLIKTALPTLKCQGCSFHNYIKLVGWPDLIERFKLKQH